MTMKVEGHYDEQADIASLRFEDYDPASIVGEETEFGCKNWTREPTDRGS